MFVYTRLVLSQILRCEKFSRGSSVRVPSVTISEKYCGQTTSDHLSLDRRNRYAPTHCLIMIEVVQGYLSNCCYLSLRISRASARMMSAAVDVAHLALVASQAVSFVSLGNHRSRAR